VTAREEYIDGLRAFANLLENVPELEIPTHGGFAGTSDKIQWLLFGGPTAEEQKARTGAIIRSIPGKWSKRDTADLFRAHMDLFGLALEVVVSRDAVCERKVVGTRKVTKQIPVKHETVEVEEDVVEWDCGSLLKPIGSGPGELPAPAPLAVTR
jgi:hypothetical protein